MDATATAFQPGDANDSVFQPVDVDSDAARPRTQVGHGRLWLEAGTRALEERGLTGVYELPDKYEVELPPADFYTIRRGVEACFSGTFRWKVLSLKLLCRERAKLIPPPKREKCYYWRQHLWRDRIEPNRDLGRPKREIYEEIACLRKDRQPR